MRNIYMRNQYVFMENGRRKMNDKRGKFMENIRIICSPVNSGEESEVIVKGCDFKRIPEGRLISGCADFLHFYTIKKKRAISKK